MRFLNWGKSKPMVYSPIGERLYRLLVSEAHWELNKRGEAIRPGREATLSLRPVHIKGQLFHETTMQGVVVYADGQHIENCLTADDQARLYPLVDSVYTKLVAERNRVYDAEQRLRQLEAITRALDQAGV